MLQLKKKNSWEKSKNHKWGTRVLVKKGEEVCGPLAPSPIVGGLAILPLIGLDMGVIISQWVTGSPPRSSHPV